MPGFPKYLCRPFRGETSRFLDTSERWCERSIASGKSASEVITFIAKILQVRKIVVSVTDFLWGCSGFIIGLRRFRDKGCLLQSSRQAQVHSDAKNN